MRTLNDYFLTTVIENIGGASQRHVLVAPDTGKIIKVYTAINGTIATADEDIIPRIEGTTVTNGTVTITASGSANGDVDEATPTAANHVVEGQYIEIINDSACTNDVDCSVTLVIRR